MTDKIHELLNFWFGNLGSADLPSSDRTNLWFGENDVVKQKIMKILMCRPDYYGIEYEINPWMKTLNKVNHATALLQWEALFNTILACGAQIELVAPVSGWPDMVFTANAGLVYRNQIILSRFKHKERRGELPYFSTWFTQAGFNILNPLTDKTNVYFFEGAGDALLAGDILFAGYGFRTDVRFYEKAAYLDHHQLVYCELTNPYFYHLDTCFCPLTNELAMWYPPAFTPESQKRMSAQIELIAVVEEEAKRFACNAIVLGNRVIMPTECPQIETQLQKHGFIVYPCEMNEYLKAGGACKCLTLRLN